MANAETLELLKTRAAAVGMKVAEVKNLEEALNYAIDVCDKKEMAQLYMVERNGKLSALAQEEVIHAEAKTIAVPVIDEKSYDAMAKQCAKKGIVTIREDLRNPKWMAGMDVGVAVADKCFADNPTCVFACNDENLRLALSVAEEYIFIVPKSRVVKTSYDAEDWLREQMQGINYIDFISSSSRTADIERVLAIGVHGSLLIHLVITEE